MYLHTINKMYLIYSLIYVYTTHHTTAHKTDLYNNYENKLFN